MEPSSWRRISDWHCGGYLSMRYGWVKRIGTVPILSVIQHLCNRRLSVGYRGCRWVYVWVGLVGLLVLSGCFEYIFAEEGVDDEKVNVALEIKNLRSKNLNKKLAAIRKLGKAREKRATQELLKALKAEKNINMKCKIIESLSNTADDTVTEELVSIIKTTDNVVDVRWMAVISLGKKDEKVIQVLREVFLNENEEVSLRLRALEELSLVRGNPVAFETVIAATEDRDPLVRRVAVGLLWQSYYPQEKDRIMPIFQRMLQDTDEEVRNSVKQILEYRRNRRMEPGSWQKIGHELNSICREASYGNYL